MMRIPFGVAGFIASALILLQPVSAATLAKLSFEQLTDNSEVVVSGTVTRSWTAWDMEHKYIWTHYEMSVSATHKGAAGVTVDVAEPGGELNGVVMSIMGATGYRVGDHVLVFLSRMPNGYLRTAGFGQGKYVVDTAGEVHGDTTLGLNGIDVSAVRQKVLAHVKAQTGGAR